MVYFEKMRAKLNKKLTPFSFFMIGLLVLNAFMIIQLPLQDGKAFFSLLHSDIYDTFMDFFNSIFDASFANPYSERGVIYPPLSYVYYRLCGYLLPADVPPFFWQSTQSGMILAIVMTVLSIYVLYKVLQPAQNGGSNQDNRYILFILLGTVPFWYAIERGNLILQTLVFLVYFIRNYQSKTPVKRELSLISLAIATSFKIYPAIFGILLVLDKQYKAALRCIVYGVLIFFVPFCFFGGLDSLLLMIKYILATNEIMLERGWGYKVNIDNTFHFLEELLQVQLPYTSIFKGMILVSLIFVLFFSKKNWQKYMALSAAMIIFPAFSYTYTLIFVAIPLLAFFEASSKITTRNMLFSFLFLCMFAPFPYGGVKLIDAAPNYVYQLNLTTIVSSFSLIAMILLMPFDVIVDAMTNYGILNISRVNNEKTSIVHFFIILASIVILFIAGYVYCSSIALANPVS